MINTHIGPIPLAGVLQVAIFFIPKITKSVLRLQKLIFDKNESLHRVSRPEMIRVPVFMKFDLNSNYGGFLPVSDRWPAVEHPGH